MTWTKYSSTWSYGGHSLYKSKNIEKLKLFWTHICEDSKLPASHWEFCNFASLEWGAPSLDLGVFCNINEPSFTCVICTPMSCIYIILCHYFQNVCIYDVSSHMLLDFLALYFFFLTSQSVQFLLFDAYIKVTFY